MNSCVINVIMQVQYNQYDLHSTLNPEHDYYYYWVNHKDQNRDLEHY